MEGLSPSRIRCIECVRVCVFFPFLYFLSFGHIYIYETIFYICRVWFGWFAQQQLDLSFSSARFYCLK